MGALESWYHMIYSPHGLYSHVQELMNCTRAGDYSSCVCGDSTVHNQQIIELCPHAQSICLALGGTDLIVIQIFIFLCEGKNRFSHFFLRTIDFHIMVRFRAPLLQIGLLGFCESPWSVMPIDSKPKIRIQCSNPTCSNKL